MFFFIQKSKRKWSRPLSEVHSVPFKFVTYTTHKKKSELICEWVCTFCLYKSCAFDHFFYGTVTLVCALYIFFTMKTFHPSVIHFVLFYYVCCDIMSILFFHPVYGVRQLLGMTDFWIELFIWIFDKFLSIFFRRSLFKIEYKNRAFIK